MTPDMSLPAILYRARMESIGCGDLGTRIPFSSLMPGTRARYEKQAEEIVEWLRKETDKWTK